MASPSTPGFPSASANAPLLLVLVPDKPQMMKARIVGYPLQGKQRKYRGLEIVYARSRWIMCWDNCGVTMLRCADWRRHRSSADRIRGGRRPPAAGLATGARPDK